MTASPAAIRIARFPLPVYLALCLILGGSASAGVLANGFIQLLAVPILAVIGWRTVGGAVGRGAARQGDERLFWALLAIAIGWPLFQLVPLPAALWQALPGRQPIVAGDAILGMESVWRPISLQPRQTLYAALGWLPPLAVLALALRADEVTRRAAIATILVVGILSSAVGIIQLGQGTGGTAYFYRITNSNTSVGFFANSNHLATLFLICACFCVELPFHTARREHVAVWRIVRIALFLFFLLNLAVNRSLAGYALAVPVVVYFAVRSESGRRLLGQTRRGPALAMAAAVGVTLVIGWLARDLLLGATLNTTDPSRRLLFFTNTIAIAREMFPVGSGFGTFRWVYAGIEDIDKVTLTYVNHAHNDYLEMLSTLGAVGIVLQLGFVVWLLRACIRLARRQEAVASYAPAAALALGLIAAHSLVDYPARTSAIAAIGALCAALLLRPGKADDQATPARASAAR